MFRELVQKGLQPPVLVFVQTKERAQELFKELLYDGIHVDVIHSERYSLIILLIHWLVRLVCHKTTRNGFFNAYIGYSIVLYYCLKTCSRLSYRFTTSFGETFLH
jgi:hypothetical protein